jgi:hypothetical protein
MAGIIGDAHRGRQRNNDTRTRGFAGSSRPASGFLGTAIAADPATQIPDPGRDKVAPGAVARGQLRASVMMLYVPPVGFEPTLCGF